MDKKKKKTGQPLPFKQYIWQLAGFPHALTWEAETVIAKLLEVSSVVARLSGRVESTSNNDLEEIYLMNATEAVKDSSAIEGDLLHYHDVRSSVAKQLGIKRHGIMKSDRRTDAVVKMMTDAMDISQPISHERLMVWHGLLFPDGPQPKFGLFHVAAYRALVNDPMVVVSGQPGKEKVHFLAPPADTLDTQMTAFIDWCNNTDNLHPILKSAVAHFWFVTLHPFDDGNGRLARAIGDYFLAKADNLSQRFYSLSSTILNKRKSYYQVLEQTQKGGLDITPWILWYLDTVHEAVTASSMMLGQVMAKTRFWLDHQDHDLNQRQKKVLNLLMGDFKGNLKSDKYAKLTSTSQDTALRDLKHLVAIGILAQKGQGKATTYELVK